ncbi:MAG: hypothetical protein Q9227_002146 [Pyrenula ochraceoflavens]
MGTMHLSSHCEAGTVWYAMVGHGIPDPPNWIQIDAGKDVQFPLSKYTTTDPNQGNYNLKIARSPAAGQKPIDQIEFGVDSEKLFYDLSVIDGNVFHQDGIEIIMDQCPNRQFPTCETLNCPPNVPCSDGYNFSDDVKTKSCSPSVNMFVNLCSGQGSALKDCPSDREEKSLPGDIGQTKQSAGTKRFPARKLSAASAAAGAWALTTAW